MMAVTQWKFKTTPFNSYVFSSLPPWKNYITPGLTPRNRGDLFVGSYPLVKLTYQQKMDLLLKMYLLLKKWGFSIAMLPPWSLTWPPKSDLPKIIFQPSFFRCYVSFREGSSPGGDFAQLIFPSGKIPSSHLPCLAKLAKAPGSPTSSMALSLLNENGRNGRYPIPPFLREGGGTLQGMDTYPTKREVRKIIDSKCHFLGGDMLIPWRVSLFFVSDWLVL